MNVIAEGKTKKIVATDSPFLVDIVSKDDITAGDGDQHDVIKGKAAASTRMTCNVLELLERNGIPTHFLSRVDDVTFRARKVEMIPLELVARRYATGSYLDRFPDVADGTFFEVLVFEVFEKDDASHDPLLVFNFSDGFLTRYVPNAKAAQELGSSVKAGDIISREPLRASRYASVTAEKLNQLHSMTDRAFRVIEAAWARLGGVYIDFKIECGVDPTSGELIVADVIDSDSGRLRFGGVDSSKESYRDGSLTLPELKLAFEDVATMSDEFGHLGQLI